MRHLNFVDYRAQTYNSKKYLPNFKAPKYAREEIKSVQWLY